MKQLLTTFLVLMGLSTAMGQLMTENKLEIDPDRYGEVKGSPYYFEDHFKAKVKFKNE